MEYLTTVELSEKWNITPRRIGVLCSEGRIDGAIKKGKTWLIPYGAIKPADGRKNRNFHIFLPLSVEWFLLLYYYTFFLFLCQ